MTPERWKQAQALLDQVLEKPRDEREQALEAVEDLEMVRDVRSLIRAIETRDTLLDHAPQLPAAALADRAPAEVGPYRLLDSLGEGGMGSVYLAERRDEVHHKKVAVKLLRGGFVHPELEQRFRGEREILAHLEHPHIARLLDGGATEEGRPFLVMEYVQGEPIDRFCDRRNSSIEERLTLFRHVCAAVQFAHRNLVVHRDLKPGNILVTEDGEPKLLDFGIAKLLSPESLPMTMVQTRTGGGPMTPAYASPEQLTGGSITTASDVYSLGVLLYELLTGRRPFDLSGGPGTDTLVQQLSGSVPTLPSQAVQREMAGGEPQDELSKSALAERRGSDPRQLQKRLRGDLDSILLKALAGAPDRRYASAEQLGDDLRRHLQGMPVRAREGTTSYRAMKFVRRHRWAVASAVGVFVVLVAFILTLLAQRREVTAQSQRAETTAGFLSRLFYTTDPISGSGANLTARDLLDRGRQQIDLELADLPRIQASLQAVIGRAYVNLGDLQLAEELLTRSLALRREILPEDHPEIADGERLLCLVLNDQARYGEAEDACRRALAMSRRLDSGPNRDLMESLYRLANVLGHVERGRQEADDLLSQSLAMARRMDDPEKLSQILNSYGSLKTALHDNQEALALYEEGLDIVRRDLGEDHPRLGVILTNMSGALTRLGNEKLAAERLQQALAQQQRIYPKGHPKLASTLFSLGVMHEESGRYGDAEASYLDALEMYRQHLDTSHPSLAKVMAQMASLYVSLERLDEAEPMALEALRIRRQRLGSDNTTTASSCNFLAGVYRDLKRFDEADALYQESLAIYRNAVGDHHQLTATSLSNYATFLNHRQRWRQALPLYRQAIDIFTELNGPETRDVSLLTYNLAVNLHRVEEYEEAETSFRRAIDLLAKISGDDHPVLVVMQSNLGHLLIDRGRLDAAAELSRRTLELAAAKLPEGHRFVRAAQRLQGRLLLIEGQSRRAEDVLLPLFTAVRDKKGLDDNESRDLLELLIQVYRQTDQPRKAQEMQALRAAAEPQI